MYDLCLAAGQIGFREIVAWWRATIAAVLQRWAAGNERAAVPVKRDVRLDLFRGLALWFIFVDHIPGNIVSHFTVRAFGFSDATEIFVFISGYTAALVYGKSMREQGFLEGAARIVTRTWQIYVAHVFLFVMYAAAIVFVAARSDDAALIAKTGIADFLREPGFMFVQVLALRYKPANMDVLPMYIAVMAAFAPMLWWLIRRPNLALLGSLVLYVVARRSGWSIGSHAGGTWYFNPFAWQLLFVFGAWCALGGAARLAGLIRTRAAGAAAAGYLLFALAIVTTWHVPALADAVPEWLAACIYPIEKRNLDVLRIIHFLSLALLTVRLVGAERAFLNARWLRPATLCGAHSLEIFCLGVVLSFMAHAALAALGGGIVLQVLVSLAGIAIMVGTAGLMTWSAGIDGHKPRASVPQAVAARS